MKDKVIVGVVGLIFMVVTVGCYLYDITQTKYKMNLKCVQGELYEEVRPNMFVKSHLECFEQKTLVP
jgi:hypothetical protein